MPLYVSTDLDSALAENTSKWLDSLVCMAIPARDIIAAMKPDRPKQVIVVERAIHACELPLLPCTVARPVPNGFSWQALSFFLLDLRPEEELVNGRLPLAFRLDPDQLVALGPSRFAHAPGVLFLP